jgi:hypothetical protein
MTIAPAESIIAGGTRFSRGASVAALSCSSDGRGASMPRGRNINGGHQKTRMNLTLVPALGPVQVDYVATDMC